MERYTRIRAFTELQRGLSDPDAHTKRPTARGGNKPRSFGSLYHFMAFAHAQSCFGLLLTPLLAFFSTRLYLEPLFPWLSGRKSFSRRRTRVSGRRVRRFHAARPMRRRVPVPIALRLALLVLVLAPPSSSPRPCFASLTRPCCRLGPPGPRSPTPRLVVLSISANIQNKMTGLLVPFESLDAHSNKKLASLLFSARRALSSRPIRL
jgi:hypothetical protein